MSTWTTQRAGSMNTVSTDPASPWYDGGTQTARASVPVDGDNIVGANAAYTLTLPAGATMTVGTAPATGGTAAIDTVAPLVINGVLHVKGDGTNGKIIPYVNDSPGEAMTIPLSSYTGLMYAIYGVKAGSSSAETFSIDLINIRGQR